MPTRKSVESATEGGAAVAHADLDILFARSAQRLLRATGAAAVLALARGAGGAARVMACAALGPEPAVPDAKLLSALAAQTGAIDLGRPAASDPELAAARLGYGAGVAVGRVEGEASAVLLLAGAKDPPGAVRARTLAELGAVARRLEGPATASAALARLGRLDAEVQRLDRLAALGELLAEIAHEVRNPLVSVKTFLQLVPDRFDDPQFRERFREVVSDEVRRIERLLDSVLAHARPRNGPVSGGESAAGPVLEGVAQILAQRGLERGIALEVSAPDDAPYVPMGNDRLRQVVLNLTLNALEATPAGGRVSLWAGTRGGATEIRVEDQGPGVPEALRERIFEPFFTSKPERPGGLGLAISRRLVEEAGGNLTVEDVPGGGARFRVRFSA